MIVAKGATSANLDGEGVLMSTNQVAPGSLKKMSELEDSDLRHPMLTR